MARPLVKFFIELGSSRFKLVGVSGGTYSRAHLQVWSVPAKGMRKGCVLDASLAISALETLVSKAEQFMGAGSIRAAKLIVPGYLLQCRSVETRHALHDGVVSGHLQNDLQESLITSAADDGLEVIDSVVQAWNLDGITSEHFPNEKRGKMLSLVAFCSICESSLLSSFIEVCNAVGIEIKSLGSSSTAAAKLISTLSPEASNRVLLDVGHSHSALLLQVGSRLNSSYAVAVGSQLMTRDIAAGLGCDIPTADQYKMQIGLSFSQQDRFIALPAVGASSTESENSAAAETTRPVTIYPWLAPRVAEQLKLIHKHFALYSKALDGGVIVFGGGSLLPGFTAFAASKWDGLSISRFKPTSISLGVALDVEVLIENDELLLGSEGLIGAASEYLQQLRADSKNALASRSPQFLRPLLTWFSELAR